MEGDAAALLDWSRVGLEAGAIIAGALLLVALAALTQRTRKTGFQLGDEFARAGVVESWEGRAGYVRVGGELWRAEAKAALAPGDAVKVARKDGMLLRVTPL